MASNSGNNSKSWDAANGNGENASIGAGPEQFPRNSIHENPGSPGNPFGDRSPRTPETQGSSLALGLSCKMDIHAELMADDDGQCSDESTGKPDGPEMGNVDNAGASAKLSWG